MVNYECSILNGAPFSHQYNIRQLNYFLCSKKVFHGKEKLTQPQVQEWQIYGATESSLFKLSSHPRDTTFTEFMFVEVLTWLSQIDTIAIKTGRAYFLSQCVSMATFQAPPGHTAQPAALIAAQLGGLTLNVSAPDPDLKVCESVISAPSRLGDDSLPELRTGCCPHH